MHPWFEEPREDILYMMMEIRPESLHVLHHIQKITGFFLAMRTFADKLRQKGFQVRYFRITNPDNRHAFKENLKSLVNEHRIPSGAFLEPAEYRLDHLLEEIFTTLFKTSRISEPTRMP